MIKVVEKGFSLIEVAIGMFFFSIISLSMYNYYNKDSSQHYMYNISIVMCRYADALSQYLQTHKGEANVSLSDLVSTGYLPYAPNENTNTLGGWFTIKLYSDNSGNGLIALYGDEQHSLTVDNMKKFLGIRGASIQNSNIVSAGDYYSLPAANFTGFITDNLKGIMLVPAIKSSGQNCYRGGYDF
ncbi:TPA: hypothetical protein M2Q89_004860 [Escherichia coli]|nr:hypothetical protein [Escherichia coli]